MSLRELLIDWLTSSRYVRWLEARHIEQRQDYTERLAEKDRRISELKTEVVGLKLENDRLRKVVPSPLRSLGVVKKDKPPVVPAFEPPLDWAAELEAAYKEEASKDDAAPAAATDSGR